MKKFFAFLVGFLALALATTTAFFSVYGISKLFMGEVVAVIILFSLLEAAKITFVSIYHQFSNYLKIFFKGILIFFVVILMCVTSIGVYGFLTSAYSSTSVELQKLGGQTEIYNKKIEIKKEEKSALNEQIVLKNTRIITLSELRKSQETRVDSLYQRGHYKSARQTETIIKEANNDIHSIAKEVDSLNNRIQIVNDSISLYEMKKLELNSGDLFGEIGPLKYISTITGLPMDNVVNWLMLIFIFLSDPGAILLVILTNKIIKIIRKENEEKRNLLEIAKKKREYNEPIKEVEPLTEKLEESIVEEPVVDEPLTEKLEESIVEEPAMNEPLTEKIEESIVEEPAMNEPTVEKVSIPIEENQEIAEYVSNEKGDFVKTKNKTILEKNKISVNKDTIVPGILTAYTGDHHSAPPFMPISPESKSEYLLLLKKFYKDGVAKKGEKIPTFPEFKKSLESEGVNVKEKVMKDFLVICGLFNITMFENANGVYDKEYYEAGLLISQI